MSGQLDRPDRAAASTGSWLIRSSGLPTGIWVLGFVSMLMDISSEMIHALTLLAIGLVLLLGADLALAFASDIVWVGVGVLFWGLHMGFTQGLLATLIAESAPPELRGTAFGVFNLVTGIALLAASVVAGALWDMAGRKAHS